MRHEEEGGDPDGDRRRQQNAGEDLPRERSSSPEKSPAAQPQEGEERAEHDALGVAGEELQRENESERGGRAAGRNAGSLIRSIAKSAQGHSDMTDVWGKSSHGTIVKENAKTTAPNSAAVRERPSSASHSEAPPLSATNSFRATARLNALASGSAIMRNVKGKNAADWPLAASGDPQPFHRFRQGSEPSFHAIRTAFAHGAISVDTSFRFGSTTGGCGSAFHGGRLIVWSTGKIVRFPVNAGRRKSAGRSRNEKNLQRDAASEEPAAGRMPNAAAA